MYLLKIVATNVVVPNPPLKMINNHLVSESKPKRFNPNTIMLFVENPMKCSSFPRGLIACHNTDNFIEIDELSCVLSKCMK